MPRVDIAKAFSTQPPAQDFILPGFLAGTVGALVAPGSTGKSAFAMQIACAVASPQPQANTTGLVIRRHGSVLYLNLEDPPGEIERRLHSLGSRFDFITRQSVVENLQISARVGVPTDILDEKFHKALLEAANNKRLAEPRHRLHHLHSILSPLLPFVHGFLLQNSFSV